MKKRFNIIVQSAEKYRNAAIVFEICLITVFFLELGFVFGENLVILPKVVRIT